MRSSGVCVKLTNENTYTLLRPTCCEHVSRTGKKKKQPEKKRKENRNKKGEVKDKNMEQTQT